MSDFFFWTKGHHLHVGDTVRIEDPSRDPMLQDPGPLVLAVITKMGQNEPGTLTLEFDGKHLARYAINQAFRVKRPEEPGQYFISTRATDLRLGDLLYICLFEDAKMEWLSVTGLSLDQSDLSVKVTTLELKEPLTFGYNHTLMAYRR